MLDEAAEVGSGVEEDAERAPGSSADITVLVVDDDAGNLASLEKIFQRDGMRAFTADSARAALEIVRKHRVQVVLSDLMMPGTSGIELLRAVRSQGCKVRFGFVTSEVSDAIKQLAREAGAAFLISKPFTADQIKAAVQQAA